MNNPVAKNAHKFNKCKIIDVNVKQYYRKIKHKKRLF